MTISHTQVTVATTATVIASGNGSYLNDLVSVLVRNTDISIVVYLGGAGVTNTTGLPLKPGESLPLILQPGEILYGAAGSGSPAVSVLVQD